tara:strand:+ start:1289 stop:1597 length:309 start_codon:yes stop_codon:yes gene_type:complete
MAQVTNKQNMTIAIREYQDNQGQTKKVWKTIGEITTWDDGSQSFEVWGPTGSTTGQVFDKQDNNQQQPQQGGYQQPQQQQQAPQQQGGYQQPPQQGGYGQHR